MPLICKDCPNKEKFKTYESGRCSYTTVRFVDQEGDTQDYGDTDYDDYDESDSETRCEECDSLNLEDVSDEEWEKWQGPQPKQHRWKKDEMEQN